MELQYIKSACVVVAHGGKKVLCDPWLTDGAYYGSWCHYPPLEYSAADFADVDYVYISHVHPDHLDPVTLRELPSDIPVIIHDFAEKFVLRIVGSAGLTNVIEVAHGETVELGTDFSLQVLAADDCNPELCGRLFDCVVPRPYDKSLQIDSMAVFKGGDRVLVNSNDCPYPLATSVCDRILEEHGEIDFMCVAYSGAGPFPQCFEWEDAEAVLKRAEAKRRQFLDQSMGFLKHLRPRWFMPFAGQYTLGGDLAELNGFRGVPELEELPSEYSRMLDGAGVDSELVLLDQGASFNVGTGSPSAPFHAPDPVARQAYIDDVLAKRRFVYQDDAHIPVEDWVDLTPRLVEPHARVRRYQEKFGGHRSSTTVYIDTGQDFLYGIPFDHNREVHRESRGNEVEPFVRLGVDYSLMSLVLNRKAHWNNAEIGSHLRYARSPDRYDRASHYFLNYLHG